MGGALEGVGQRKRGRATELEGQGGPRLGWALNALKTKPSSHRSVLSGGVTRSGWILRNREE